MGEIKNSKRADGAGYLYRCAFYLAKGDKKTSLLLLQKANQRLDSESFKELRDLLDNHKKLLTNKKNTLFWAEKVLDEYKKIILLS